MKKLVLTLDKNSDKRKKKRIEIFSNIFGKLDILGVSSNAKIKDISYSGFGVIVPQNDRLATMETLEAKLALSNQLFQGRIANRILLPNQQVKLGISLPTQVHREIDFNNLDSSWDKVTDPETVKNIYSDLAYKGPEAPIEIRQNFSKARMFPIELTSSETMICEISEVFNGALEKGKAKCMFELFQTCHAFDSTIDKLDSSKIELKISTTLARLLRRETVRVRNKDSTYKLSILLRSKSLDKEITEFKVFDYSEHGLSLLDPEGDLSLPRNLRFEEIIIEIEGIGSIFGFGEVRSYEWNRDLDTYIIGLLFKPYGEPHLTNWHNFILKARYPSLDFEYRENDHKKIWDLFQRSDYMNLSENEGFTDIFDLTKKTWIKLRDIGTSFSKRAMIRKDDKILGHIQIDQFYPNTWCVHHLAVDPTMSKLIAGELYALTTDVLLSEKGKYLINFTESTKSWNQRSYYNFIKDYRFPEHNELKQFYIYETDLRKPNFFKPSNNIDVRKPTKFDLKKVSKYFSDNLSELEVKACSLDDENLELEELNKSFNAFSLIRRREFFIAVKNDQLVGIARLEFGSEGVNVVGIQDMLYLYCIEMDGLTINDIQDTLIKTCLEYYLESGKTKITFALENDRIEDFKRNNIDFICVASRWIALKDILPRYHAFSQLLYGDLILKKERIKKKIKGSD